jgi:OmcA/MtrC family decaheme c-type cytochrome
MLLLLCCAVVVAGGFLAGCGGDDGATGPAGAPGSDAPTVSIPVDNLTQPEMEQLVMTGQITSVRIASPPVVNFWVKDQFGRGISGLGNKANTTSLDNMRFALAKLVPGAQGSPDNWVAYTGLTSATSRPSTENNGTMVDNGNGSYTYTFTTNVSSSPANAWETVYEPSRTHRMVIQISGTLAASGYAITNPLDIIYDFVPAGGAVTSKREIVTTKACNDCHGRIGTTTPHGGRTDTRYCVVCHSDLRRNGRTVSSPTSTGLLTGSTYVVNGEAQGNMVVMIHKIHKGEDLTLQGYNYANVLFNEVIYPQDIVNCRKCHQQSAEAPQGDNWKNKPSRRACGACHDNVSFDDPTPTGFAPHTGPTGTSLNGDFLCVGCHDANKIEGYHLTVNPTPNNPSVPVGLVNFTYEISNEISSVTVTNTTQPVVKFRILADGIASTFTGTGSTASSPPADAVLAGFSGSPSFLISYAQPQDGIAAPTEYNNLGKVAAQPASLSIAYLLVSGNTRGTLTGPDGSGFYTATITDAAYGFPSGSKLRTIGLQGYFTQVAGTGGIAANTARHTISVTRAINQGSTSSSAPSEQRRVVVDNAKCGGCHEWFEGHGGNRVYDVAICVMCHVPNLSSSGRGGDPGVLSAATQTALTNDGYNPADPFDTTAPSGKWPEATQNMKDMIHRIHASGVRDTEYRFLRDRGTSMNYYNMSLIVFPGIINLCETCHRPGTYDGTLPAGALPTNEVTGGEGLVTRAAVTAARASVPNATDIVNSPFVSTCIGCHDSDLTAAHIAQNGGVRAVSRSTYTAGLASETCILCHSAGKVADPAVVHILPLSLPAVIE